MGGVASAIGDAIGGVAEAVGEVVETVVENPIIATAALAVTGVPLPGVLTGLPPAVSAAAVSMASTAIQGGDFGDIIKAGAAGALGSAVGGAVGKSVASSFGDTAGKVASSAAGGFTGTLVQTGNIGTALKGAAMGAAGSAIQQGVSAGLEKVKQQFPGQITTGGTGQTTADTAKNLKVGDRIPTAPSYMTAGGTFETVAPTSPFGTLGTTSTPNLQYSPSIQERILAGAEGGITKLASESLEPTLASALGFGGQPTTQSTGPAPGAAPGVAVTGEGSAVNPAAATALAQALRVGDPGAPLFGTEGKGQQQAVWNTASLKFSDEVGG